MYIFCLFCVCVCACFNDMKVKCHVLLLGKALVKPVLNWAKCLFVEHTSDEL